MASFDCHELTEFADNLIRSSRAASKEQKKFLREEGTKLRRKTAQRARATVRKTAVKRPKYERAAGTYHKAIKRGRVWTAENGAQAVRVYTTDPIGHLVEDGWTPKARDGSRGTPQPGKAVFESAFEEFAPEFERDAEEAVDAMIRKI